MEYTRVEFSSEMERKILTGMIISSSYLKDIEIMISPKFFKIDYIRKISQWVLEYYKKYKKSPGRDFESIFYAKTDKLKSAEVDIMEEFLQSLSDQYISENQESSSFNEQLLFDQTVLFCRDRQIEILNKTVEGFRLSGDFTKAEELISNFGKIAQNVSQWINPLSNEQVSKVIDSNDKNKLFKLPGALGDLIGYMERGWLVGLLGPTKRGKSFYEWEFGFHALCAGLKVAIFEFEMNEVTYQKRIYKRMTALAENGGEYAYPVFDCSYNQNNTCKKQERTNTVPLYEKDQLPKYNPKLTYRACTACRGNGTKDYFPETWWQTQYQKEGLSSGAVLKKIKTFKKLYGDNLRLRCFPAFSAGFEEAIIELDNLRNQENFEPDVILFDYFDIMSSEVMNELEDENRKWKSGKGLAGERHCLVVNCHQGNRESEDKASLKQKHTGGSIKKLQHLDLDITLNQTEMDKRKGRMRMRILVHRHDEGAEKGEVIVLQQLSLGMPYLDSEWSRYQKKEEEIKS